MRRVGLSALHFCLLPFAFCLLIYSSINRRFTLGPSTPATVNPQPLVRMSANDRLQSFGVARCVFDGVSLLITCVDGLDRWFEMKPMNARVFIPDKIPGQHDCTGSQRKS